VVIAGIPEIKMAASGFLASPPFHFELSPKIKMAAKICTFAANPCLSFLEEKEPLSRVPWGKLPTCAHSVNSTTKSRVS